MDYGAGDIGSTTSGGAMHQNWVEGYGGASHKTPGRTPPIRGQSVNVSGPTTRDRPGRHHRRHSDKGGRKKIWSRRAGGSDSVSLQSWLLRFGVVSRELRIMLADFVEWIGNG